MKTLLSLLKKDLILVRRNKIWTFFEVLIPVLLLALPLIKLDKKLLMTYKHQQMEQKALRNMSGTVSDVELDFKSPRDKILLSSIHCKGSPEIDVQKPSTAPNREEFAKIVKGKLEICEPISGIYKTQDGFELVAPASYLDISNPSYFFRKYTPFLYEVMNGSVSTNQSNRDEDELKELYIFDPKESKLSPFAGIAFYIILCLTLPVINTARSIVVEKATIEPYLNSIGLSRGLFHAEHFVFSFLKMTVLVLAAMTAYCIVYKRFQPFWLLIGVFVYILASISFAMLMSAFFSKPRRAVEATLIIWVGSGVFAGLFYDPTGWQTIPASLNIHQALKSYFLAIEPHFVNGEDGMTFMDGFEQGRDNQYACIVYLGIMFFDFLLMAFGSVFLSKFVDCVSNYLVNLFWRKRRHVESESTISSAEIGSSGIILGEEAVHGRKNAVSDIQLDNLVKIYSNGETAVNGLSMRAIRGQVSVLLGHNGCGKSTTFGMITGITQPTSGTITIDGTDAVNNTTEVRKVIGYCPQYNPLYDKLTVMEHLKLVNALKGADSGNFVQEAESLLTQIGLIDNKKTLAKNLSGGMKRKLCVCMALIGGSRVVLLDEPTAGMDPGARQDVQKMLNQVKAEKTILLTTHYMDEADKLGDWVFVMSHGKMAASGSSVYLKKKYGDGYLLTVVLDEEDNGEDSVEVIESICQRHVEEAFLKDHRGRMVEISFPENRKDKILPLLKAFEAIIDKQYASNSLKSLSGSLSQSMRSLNIVTMGLSMSSLEHAFIKIEKECDQVLFGIDDMEKRATAEKNFAALVRAKNEPPRTGLSLICLQYRTILYKRLIHFLRNLDQLILQVIVPMVGLYFLFGWLTSIFPSTDPKLTHTFGMSSWRPSKVILQFEGTRDARIENYLSQFQQLKISYQPIGMSAEQLAETQNAAEKEGIGLIISIFENRTVVHFVESSSFDFPIALTLLTNLKHLRINSTSPVGTAQMSVQFVPFIAIGTSMFKSVISTVAFYLSVVTLSFVIIPAILFLIEEKVTKFQHQQRLSGVSPILFWTGCMLWDFMLYSIVLVYVIVMLRVFGYLTEYYHLGIPVFLLFFFAYVSFVYWLSVFFKTPSAGATVLSVHRIVTFAVGQLFFFVFMLLSQMLGSGFLTRMMYFYGFIDPGFIAMYGLTKIFARHAKNVLSMESVRTSVFEYKSIYEFFGIWIDLAFLFLLGVLFLWLFVAFRSRILKKMGVMCCMAINRPAKQYADSENGKSTSGMSSLSGSKTVKGAPVVVVDNLVKYFGKMRAVNNLSITVREKECFGLLGQNGAGKTTTFDMLTGITIPSGGTAVIDGIDISHQIEIGYCPQFDAMMGQYSGRQILRIMARLQGYSDCDEVVEMVLVCVGMTEHGDKLIQNCSGGQKRKISVGIALISRAPCVMLDEPTAGIDPRARRDIWDTLHCMREKANMSIVLTSHSMEECEALCTRIGVLRKGDMVALGTSQELKSTYGNFFLLTMVLKDSNQVNEVKKGVTKTWKKAILKTEPNKASLNMVYQLPKTPKDKWSVMYAEVKELAEELDIEDFMLTQATLEDAFIRLNADKKGSESEN